MTRTENVQSAVTSENIPEWDADSSPTTIYHRYNIRETEIGSAYTEDRYVGNERVEAMKLILDEMRTAKEDLLTQQAINDILTGGDGNGTDEG